MSLLICYPLIVLLWALWPQLLSSLTGSNNPRSIILAAVGDCVWAPKLSSSHWWLVIVVLVLPVVCSIPSQATGGLGFRV